MQLKTAKAPLLAALLVVAWTIPALAFGGLPEFTDLAKRTGDAVVNISTEKTVAQSQQMRDFFKFHQRGTPFDDFFDQFDKFFNQNPNQQPRKERSLGSGFIISQDGYIVTNNHVIQNADQVQVKLRGSKDFIEAAIVGRDPETDLALLKIDPPNGDLPTLPFGDSEKAEVGQWVIAIGNPFGLDHSVTAGIISAKGRIIGSGAFDDFIQTDASINPGNSGGPLLNMDGEVVGINTAIIASGQGIGFAIPSNMARRIIEQLKTDQAVHRGWLGITYQPVDDKTAQALGLGTARGALVNEVIAGQPAAKAGVQPGDVILKVDKTDIAEAGDLVRAVASLPPGRTITLGLWRDGKQRSVKVTLGERGDQLQAQGDDGAPGAPGDAKAILGMTVRAVAPQEAEALGVEPGKGLLVTEVDNGSPAQDSEIRPGDVILQANQKTVNSVSDLNAVYEKDANDKGVLLLLIQRQGNTIFRTITLPGK
jgi:serine protease Do